MPQYKLYYFDARGTAEVARLLFALKGQAFDDVRVSKEEWPNFKPKTPFGQMPCLSVDGKMYAQQGAINNYLAREFGFYGKTNIEGMKIDQVSHLMLDLERGFVPIMQEQDEAKKAAAAKAFVENQLTKCTSDLTKLLVENKNGFFVGEGFTLADITVLYLLSEIDAQGNMPVYSKRPELKAHCDKVLSNPKIKAYVAKRK